MIENASELEESFISHYHRFEFHEKSELPASLITALSKKIPHIAQDQWDERIAWGGVFINGREAKGDTEPLPFPCRIEYYEPKFDIKNAAEFFPKFSPEWVVYQDEFLFIIYKPAGLPCLPAREQKHFNLRNFVQAYYESIGGKEPIHMPSRLDMSTAGILVISKQKDFHNQLQRLYETRRISKEYLCLVEGSPPEEQFTVDAPIGRTPLHRVLRAVDGEDAKTAKTEFSIHTRVSPTRTILRAKPITGRTHQIRVHAAHAGFPIVGDKFYGKGSLGEELCLLSHRVSFIHPELKTELSVEIPERLLPGWMK